VVMWHIVAVVLSQLLIIMYWHNAKFGTIANIIIQGAMLLSYERRVLMGWLKTN
jgi:hypothetical protein